MGISLLFSGLAAYNQSAVMILIVLSFKIILPLITFLTRRISIFIGQTRPEISYFKSEVADNLQVTNQTKPAYIIYRILSILIDPNSSNFVRNSNLFPVIIVI